MRSPKKALACFQEWLETTISLQKREYENNEDCPADLSVSINVLIQCLEELEKAKKRRAVQ